MTQQEIRELRNQCINEISWGHTMIEHINANELDIVRESLRMRIKEHIDNKRTLELMTLLEKEGT